MKEGLKPIQRIGDICAEDYGGGAVVEDEHGLHVEYTYGLESDHPGSDRYDSDAVNGLILEVFRVPLAEEETAEEYLSNFKVDWGSIARGSGIDRAEVMELVRSTDPLKKAGAFELVAQHWGWRELDPEPMLLSYEDVEARWDTWEPPEPKRDPLKCVCETCEQWAAAVKVDKMKRGQS